jgi:hypothetical protein
VVADDEDLEAHFQGVIRLVGESLPLTRVALDPELAEPKSFLKILKARHMNWTAPRFRKIFGMRFSVSLPPLEQMNFIMYPEADSEAPIFLFFCLLTGRKLIGHVNVNCPFRDEAYERRWVAPLLAAQAKHGPFPCDDRYPEWMLKWRTPAGIYGMFPKATFDAFMACGLDYLRIYLDLAARSEPVADGARREAVRRCHAQFVDDIRTQDKAQGMIARMIGAEKARRIFYEVTT